MNRRNDLKVHAILIVLLVLTMIPFMFVINNSLRTQSEQYRSSFGTPGSLKNLARFTWYRLTGKQDKIEITVSTRDEAGNAAADAPAEAKGLFATRKTDFSTAMKHEWKTLTAGYSTAWRDLRGYTRNTLMVCAATVLGVLLLGSVSGYVFSRYRFPGRRLLFTLLLSVVMIPFVLTLVPSFMLVKKLQLLNSFWVLILPYISGGQIVAIFLFKTFFDGLPEELFESARLEGAGHFALYWHIVLPLSKQVAAVVAVMNILGVWNNFLWPLTTNTEAKYHMVSSGVYLMTQSATGQNYAAMNAAYVLSAIPLIILFVYATKPFMQGVTSGAFKA